MTPADEIRALRKEAPSKLATLCIKIVEKLKECSETSFITEKNQIAVLNCLRLLTRIIPYIFEEAEWRGFFWADSPINRLENGLAKNNVKKNPPPIEYLRMDSIVFFLNKFFSGCTIGTHAVECADSKILFLLSFDIQKSFFF